MEVVEQYSNLFFLKEKTAVGPIDDATKKISLRWTAQRTESINAFRIFVDSILNPSGTNPVVYKIGIQISGADGLPDGTWLTSKEITVSTDLSNWLIISGGISCNLDKNKQYCIVIEYVSGNITSYNQIKIRATTLQNLIIPYDGTDDSYANNFFFNGTSWIAQNSQPVYILEYIDNKYEGNPHDDSTYSLIYGSNWIGMELRSFFGQPRYVKTIAFCLVKNTNSIPLDDLYITITDGAGNLIETGTIVKKADILADSSSYTYYLNNTLYLNENLLYRVYLKSPLSVVDECYGICKINLLDETPYKNCAYDSYNSCCIVSVDSGVTWTKNGILTFNLLTTSYYGNQVILGERYGSWNNILLLGTPNVSYKFTASKNIAVSKIYVNGGKINYIGIQDDIDGYPSDVWLGGVSVSADIIPDNPAILSPAVNLEKGKTYHIRFATTAPGGMWTGYSYIKVWNYNSFFYPNDILLPDVNLQILVKPNSGNWTPYSGMPLFYVSDGTDYIGTAGEDVSHLVSGTTKKTLYINPARDFIGNSFGICAYKNSPTTNLKAKIIKTAQEPNWVISYDGSYIPPITETTGIDWHFVIKPSVTTIVGGDYLYMECPSANEERLRTKQGSVDFLDTALGFVVEIRYKNVDSGYFWITIHNGTFRMFCKSSAYDVLPNIYTTLRLVNYGGNTLYVYVNGVFKEEYTSWNTTSYKKVVIQTDNPSKFYIDYIKIANHQPFNNDITIEDQIIMRPTDDEGYQSFTFVNKPHYYSFKENTKYRVEFSLEDTNATGSYQIPAFNFYSPLKFPEAYFDTTADDIFFRFKLGTGYTSITSLLNNIRVKPIVSEIVFLFNNIRVRFPDLSITALKNNIRIKWENLVKTALLNNIRVVCQTKIALFNNIRVRYGFKTMTLLNNIRIKGFNNEITFLFNNIRVKPIYGYIASLLNNIRVSPHIFTVVTSLLNNIRVKLPNLSLTSLLNRVIVKVIHPLSMRWLIGYKESFKTDGDKYTRFLIDNPDINKYFYFEKNPSKAETSFVGGGEIIHTISGRIRKQTSRIPTKVLTIASSKISDADRKRLEEYVKVANTFILVTPQGVFEVLSVPESYSYGRRRTMQGETAPTYSYNYTFQIVNEWG